MWTIEPPPLFDLFARHRLGHQKGAAKVGVDDTVPAVEPDLEERHLLPDPRVVDEDVDPAPALDRSCHRRCDVVRVADVCRERPRRPAAGLDPGHDRLERLAPAPDDHHVGPLFGEALRDGLADALAGAGDDHGLALEAAQAHRHPPT